MTLKGMGGTMSIVRLDHLNIRAPRRVIDEVTGFYREILGLTPGPRPNFSSDGTWLYSGDHPYVHLTVDEEAIAPGKNEHLNHIAFRCKGLDAYLNRLDGANISYSDAFLPDMDMTQLFFYDPAGVQIELNFLHEKIS
jgi:catechol 2,3-dioxygenase-like lactoylglutathione lyase family enzyme